MAICKYGPLVSEVRGSVGGVTFTAGRFGKVVRARSSPVHAPTNRRTYWKGLLALADAHWIGTLTEQQRLDWRNLAAATDFTNQLDEVYHPTGLNLYVRSNSLLSDTGQARVDAAPAAAIGAHYPITYTWIDADGLYGEMIDAPIAAHKVSFLLGLPWATPIVYYTSPWQLSFSSTSVSLHAGATRILPFQGMTEDMYYFVRDRAVYADGKISAPYITRMQAQP